MISWGETSKDFSAFRARWAFAFCFAFFTTCRAAQDQARTAESKPRPWQPTDHPGNNEMVLAVFIPTEPIRPRQSAGGTSTELMP